MAQDENEFDALSLEKNYRKMNAVCDFRQQRAAAQQLQVHRKTVFMFLGRSCNSVII